jgi:hypothetical protein
MRRFTAIVAVISCLAGSATPAAAACWEAEEYEAARMRDLQTVLMVSALKCGRADPAMPGAYNAWVGRAKAKLIEGEQKLLAHFVREGDKSRYDKFTTALANRYSEYAEDARFCARAKSLLQADEKQPGVLEEIALLINSKPNGVEEVCPVKKPPVSQIVVSPFDPIPVAGAAAPAAVAAAQVASAPATEAAGAVPAEAPAPAAAPTAQVAAAPAPAPAAEAPADGASAIGATAATPAGTVSAQPQ